MYSIGGCGLLFVFNVPSSTLAQIQTRYKWWCFTAGATGSLLWEIQKLWLHTYLTHARNLRFKTMPLQIKGQKSFFICTRARNLTSKFGYSSVTLEPHSCLFKTIKVSAVLCMSVFWIPTPAIRFPRTMHMRIEYHRHQYVRVCAEWWDARMFVWHFIIS